MKHTIYIILTTLLLFASCKAKKDAVVQNETMEEKKEEVSTTKPSPETKKDTTKVVIRTGTKVGTTISVRDMEKAPPRKETDSIVEINPQAFVPPTTTKKIDHSQWDELLKRFVTKEGNVNYEGFRKNRPMLTAYINSLSDNMPENSWTEDEKLAYWMNAYNAMTVDLILRHLPLKSIKDINDPWKQRFWKLGDKYYNLDEIEHQILRKMDEPRIHFGINCASVSCPVLLDEAFTAEKVDNQLDFLAKQFINDTKRNTITSESVEISKIFKWFAKDFKQNGSLIDYLNKYSTVKISDGARVRYKDYDWALNN